MTGRILLVDDEQRLLDAIRRTMHGRYRIKTASSGAEGLAAARQAVDDGKPFAVVVTDMRMPGMSGAEFLGLVRPVSPDSVFMILSGQADLAVTISAVNNANLFRFLTKPIESEALAQALDAALRQHQLVVAERELLQNTLTGAVDVLTDVLSMASSVASRRTERTRAAVREAADSLGVTGDWRLPVAAMLSHLGCISLPGTVLEKVDRGDELDPAEQEMWDGHPAVARRLLTRIPRLEDVAEWVGAQPTSLPGAQAPADGPVPDVVASILPAVATFFAFCDAGFTGADVGRRVAETGRYPSEVVDAVMRAVARHAPRGFVTRMHPDGLREGMLLVDDVETSTGLVLVRQGERVTEAMIARLRNFARSVGVKEPFRVLVEE